MSFSTGPPSDPPKLFWTNGGLSSPARLPKNVLELSALLRWYSKRLPRKVLVPEREAMLMTPPVNRPNSALLLLVCTLELGDRLRAGRQHDDVAVGRILHRHAVEVDEALWFAVPPPTWKLPAANTFLPVRLPSLPPCGTTEGASVIRFRTLRPFSGNSCTGRLPTTMPTDAFSVCSTGAVPLT